MTRLVASAFLLLVASCVRDVPTGPNDPADAKATISASVTNGGIDAGSLPLETTESTRRKLEARLNGGGPTIKIGGTNGGIRLASR